MIFLVMIYINDFFLSISILIDDSGKDGERYMR